VPNDREKARKPRNRVKRTASVQENLIKALNHPVRAKAWAILSERTASPKQIADQLGEQLGNVSYHVKVLQDLGFVDVVEEEQVRGAVAHFYKSTDLPRLTHIPLTLDQSGWKKVAEIQARAVERARKEQSAAARRLNGSTDGEIHATLGIFFFEVAPDAPGKP
jgi:DNA-binding transcriptional ArsR family regulator